MIERLKQEAEPSLSRSTIIWSKGEFELSEGRTSMNAWIEDHIKQPFTSIPKRISAITGMNALGPTGADLLQVASYAFGGHYNAHWDAVSITCGIFSVEMVQLSFNFFQSC